MLSEISFAAMVASALDIIRFLHRFCHLYVYIFYFVCPSGAQVVSLELGDHPNIVKMLCCAVQQAPWLVVLELLSYGDLRGLLKACESKNLVLKPGEQLNYAVQIAEGCAHIAGRGLVHMDLAARNVLVHSGNLVKVGEHPRRGETQRVNTTMLPLRFFARGSICLALFDIADVIFIFVLLSYVNRFNPNQF